jgi:hypothetical protein
MSSIGNTTELFKLDFIHHPPTSKLLRLQPLHQALGQNSKLIAPRSGGRFPVSVALPSFVVNLAPLCLHVSERRRFSRKSGNEWDKGAHDGGVVLRCSVMITRVAADPQNSREAEAAVDAPARDRASVLSATRKMETMTPRVPLHVSGMYDNE